MTDLTDTRHGVTGDDLAVVNAIHGSGWTTVDDLTEYTGLSASQVNQSLNRLISAGLVQVLDGEGRSGDVTPYTCRS